MGLFLYYVARYFEAERRMLVLDTLIVDVPNGDCGSFRTNSSCLSVVVICPTLKHLESLRLDCSSGQLRDDLEQRLLTADLIDELNAEVDAVRLEVQLDVDDVELAQSDFQQWSIQIILIGFLYLNQAQSDIRPAINI